MRDAISDLRLHSAKPVEGAEVFASAFPVIPEKGFRKGTQLNLLDLPVSYTDTDGHFSVAVDQRLHDYVDRWGRVSISLTVTNGDTAQVLTKSMVLANDTARSLGLLARGPSTFRAPAPEVSFDLASGSVADTLGEFPTRQQLPVRALSASWRTAMTAAREADTAQRRHPCRVTAGDKHRGLYERFLYTDNWAGAKFTVTQGSGTSHELGIAYKVGGESWKVSAGETRTVSTSDKATLSDQVQKWQRNRVSYQDFHYEGFCEYPGEHTDRVPYGIYDLLVGPVKAPTAPTFYPAACTQRRNNYSYTKNTASNYTVSGGVDLGAVNVSAKSGYNSATSWTVDVTKRTRSCMSNEEGPLSSRYILFWKPPEPGPCEQRQGAGAGRCRSAPDRVQ
jgi:hypothetical protein